MFVPVYCSHINKPTAGINKKSRPSSASTGPQGARQPMTSWGEYDSLRKNSQSPSVTSYMKGKMIEFHSVEDEMFSESDEPPPSTPQRSVYDDQDYIPMFSPETDVKVEPIEPPPPPISETDIITTSATSSRPPPKMSTFKPDSMQDIAQVVKRETGGSESLSSDSGRDSEDSLTRLTRGNSHNNSYENLPPRPHQTSLRNGHHSLPRSHGNSPKKLPPFGRKEPSSPSDSGFVVQDEPEYSPATRPPRKQQMHCDDLVAEMEQYAQKHHHC